MDEASELIDDVIDEFSVEALTDRRRSWRFVYFFGVLHDGGRCTFKRAICCVHARNSRHSDS